jgi:hypothetical protein
MVVTYSIVISLLDADEGDGDLIAIAPPDTSENEAGMRQAIKEAQAWLDSH